MRIDLHHQTLRHILSCLERDETFIECGFNFQISGKDDGEEFMKNGSASFIKDSFENIIVSYNGKHYDLNYWLDCSDYDEANMDAITLTYINFS